MDSQRLDDFLLLADEKFDFELSLSSSSANEDDDVFFGPAGHKEQCVAAGVGVSHHPPEGPAPKAGSHFPWSPLTGEKFVEVYREAHMLALQIGGSAGRGSVSEAAADPRGQAPEVFVQESALKISLFEKGCEVEKSPTSLKRETYCLSESPLLGPAPSGLQPAASLALRLGSTPTPQSTPAQASLPRLPEPRPSSQTASTAPPGTAPPPKRITSKLQPPRALAARGRSIPSAMEKPERERPASPSRVTFHEKASHPEVPPERPRVAQGAVPGPASSSLVPSKRVPPVSSKLGLKRTLLRPPGRTGSLARKSFSSGPVPGALPVPAQPTGPGKSGERVSIPANSSRTLSNTRNPSRLRPTTQQRSRPTGPADTSSKQTKSADVAQVTGGLLEASAASLTQSQTPENAGVRLNSTFILPESSQPSTAKSTIRQDADLESKTKALHAPPNPFKTPKSSVGVSPVSATPQSSRTQRPLSCASLGRAVHSTPVRRASGPAPQSLLPSSTRTPLSTKRALAMPTPASHRLSGLPFITPRSIPRALASPQCGPIRRLSSEPWRRSGARDHPAAESSRKPLVRPSDSSSSSEGSVSPLSVVPQELRFSPEKSDFALSKNLTAEAPLPEAKTAEKASPNEAVLVNLQLDQLSITPKTESKPLADLPLIDFCNTPEASGDQCPPKPFGALASESRPLIDLMVNTPDANKDAALKPLQVVGQLIDLASPLIQLSPAADKENVESPLLKF